MVLHSWMLEPNIYFFKNSVYTRVGMLIGIVVVSLHVYIFPPFKYINLIDHYVFSRR